MSAAQTSSELRHQIEYSKSNRSSCKGCKKTIGMDELRLGHEVKSRMFDGYDVRWYHIRCAKLTDIHFINQLKHFELLRWNDFLKIKEILGDQTPVDNVLQRQNYNDEVWAIKDKLSSELKAAQIKQIYETNYSLEGLTPAFVLHCIADGMAYGRIGPCPTCNNLSVQYDGNHYYCKGWVTSFTKCDWYGPNIKRYRFKFPTLSSKYIKEFTFSHAHPFEELTDYVPPNKNNTPTSSTKEITDDGEEVITPTSLKPIVKKDMPAKGSIYLTVDPECTVKGEIAVEQSDIYGYTAYNVSLVFADMVYGSNSFYKLQMIKQTANKYHIFRKWGRIGVSSVGGTTVQSFGSLADALDFFKEHFLDKTGFEWDQRGQHSKIPGKYYMVDLEDGEQQDDDSSSNNNGALEEQFSSKPSQLPIPVQFLMKLLFDVNQIKDMLKSMKFDLSKMPLGKISQNQINNAFKVLTEIQDLLANEASPRFAIVDASNRFYTLIPHDFGRNAPTIIDNLALLREKIRLVEAMADIEISNGLRRLASQSGNSLDNNYDTLKTKITPVDRDSWTFNMLEEFARSSTDTQSHPSQFTIKEIYQVEREGEEEQFEQWAHNPNKMLLWHGSRASNWNSILAKGLRIAPKSAPKQGYRCGKGIYMADCFSVSLGYCAANQNYPHAILALIEAAVGSSDTIVQDTYMEEATFGYQSTKALGQRGPISYDTINDTTVLRGPVVSTGTQSQFTHNEYVIYNQSQAKIKYLFVVENQF